MFNSLPGELKRSIFRFFWATSSTNQLLLVRTVCQDWKNTIDKIYPKELKHYWQLKSKNNASVDKILLRFLINGVIEKTLDIEKAKKVIDILYNDVRTVEDLIKAKIFLKTHPLLNIQNIIFLKDNTIVALALNLFKPEEIVEARDNYCLNDFFSEINAIFALQRNILTLQDIYSLKLRTFIKPLLAHLDVLENKFLTLNQVNRMPESAYLIHLLSHKYLLEEGLDVNQVLASIPTTQGLKQSIEDGSIRTSLHPSITSQMQN